MFSATYNECSGESEANYLGVFIFAQALHAVGGAAVHTLALPYLDENVDPINTPLYIGECEEIQKGTWVLGSFFFFCFLREDLRVACHKLDTTDTIMQ